MNVASLELCKELFALSGWDGSHFTWVTKTEGKVIGTFPVERGQYSANEICDAYDLGYLRRKVPDEVAVMKASHSYRDSHPAPEDGYFFAVNNHGSWAWSEDGGGAKGLIETYASTPENAACLLAIELFRRGTITKEDA